MKALNQSMHCTQDVKYAKGLYTQEYKKYCYISFSFATSTHTHTHTPKNKQNVSRSSLIFHRTTGSEYFQRIVDSGYFRKLQMKKPTRFGYFKTIENKELAMD
jgi:hypothetical protein